MGYNYQQVDHLTIKLERPGGQIDPLAVLVLRLTSFNNLQRETKLKEER